MALLRASATAALIVAASAEASIAKVTIFATASTAGPVGEIIRLFNAKGSGSAVASFASSSTLAQQIVHGAPADIYLSASPQWMDYLAAQKAIEPSSRLDLLANRLVLIAPADSAMTARIAPSFPLLPALAGGMLAMGDPDHVPAGIYGKAALISLGAWDSVSGRVAGTQDVRAALALVEHGEAAAGIVYATDALLADRVRVIADFPPSSHPPIIYPVAIIAGRDSPEVRDFFALLKSGDAAAIFTKHGFIVLHRLLP
ncbi:MAG: molybdate ABC transporter substrate-binding protein [Rhodospirillales bacterium RIFCSPLOWO2_12_FULL_58_28]|nr:MAG: molybdate ABC transporter substrate-binding protein [Rhodospirillales bacterium RIFCSPLOWO2_02_FULL_58_16]OHC77110.1 MAG: molybdate ABC transporter substrate-binding protein [Rhodospirillales bacterium RIFCSPLOWO2_12_FULL_58_28]